MSNRFQNKVLFATGAARGLCKVIVERFLAEGANVLAFDFHNDNLAGVIKEWNVGERVIPFVGDVRKRDEHNQLQE